MCIYLLMYTFVYIGATLGDGPGAHHSWRHDDA